LKAEHLSEMERLKREAAEMTNRVKTEVLEKKGNLTLTLALTLTLIEGIGGERTGFRGRGTKTKSD